MLPKGFEVKSNTSRYTMKNLDDKGTRVRCLSDFIQGISVWSGHTKEDRKPNRFRIGDKVPTSCIGTNPFNGNPERIKQFIACIVWNYRTEQLEVLEIDKITVIEQITEIELNEDYGDSKDYDITLKKTGENTDTKYFVTPSPPKPVNKDILELYEQEPINLEALYDGEDPFNPLIDPDQIDKELSNQADISV